MNPSIEDDYEIIDVQTRPPPAVAPREDKAFDDLLAAMQRTARNSALERPIFHARLVESEANTSLFQIFLDNLPEAELRPHNCRACRRFIDKYGDLCVVNDDGSLTSLLWPEDVTEIPQIYQNAVGAISSLFKGKVVYSNYVIRVDKHKQLGTLKAEDVERWHFHVVLEDAPIRDDSGALPFDTAYEMLSRVLADNSLENINKAHSLIQNKLPYSTSHKPAISWLQKVAIKLHCLGVLGDRDSLSRRNILHFHAREAWTGCLSSLRGGVIGELLGWVSDGLEYEMIERKWSALANPLNYLRPTATPSLRNIEAAEKALQQLGMTREDLRRYLLATDELPDKAILWKSESLWSAASQSNSAETTDEIFGSLKAQVQRKSAETTSAPGVDDNAPPTSISFRQFVRRVLPTISSLELHLGMYESATFFTRGSPGSKSPFVFDSMNRENTMSWYYWRSSKHVESANLKAGWNQVSAIATFPHVWDYLSPQEALEWDKSTEPEGREWIHSRHDVRYLFCLNGAMESDTMGLCLFPTTLKNEFHGIRKTIEAFSAAGRMEWPWNEKDGKAQVGGIAVGKEYWEERLVRVRTDKGIVTQYKITLFE
ncbi:hypothetical protein CC2G_004176 [Coprinopsis cinerea AmutBmut pab1-1]|nr:hypothetical protein CC2G_004176 [Coprinopsis cinerea AmutBmut pab1-1]